MKQEQARNVIHLELNGKHYYFGSLKALCDNFSREEIGITYKSLANFKVTPDRPYCNKLCTVRKGTLIAASKGKVSKDEINNK